MSSRPGVLSGSIFFTACRHSALVSRPSQSSFSSLSNIFLVESSKKNCYLPRVVRLYGNYKGSYRNVRTHLRFPCQWRQRSCPVFNWLITPLFKCRFSRFKKYFVFFSPSLCHRHLAVKIAPFVLYSIIFSSSVAYTYRNFKFENGLNVPSGIVVVLSSTTDLKTKANEKVYT